MENDKQPVKKFRILDTKWGVWGLIIVAYGLIFLVGFLENKSSTKECDAPGCSNTCEKDEKYCNKHRNYDLHRQGKQNSTSRSLKNTDTAKQKSVDSSKGTVTNNNSGDIYGADRFDNPDDFADEWEDDFDSWEDAYDYWEDVMD